MIKFGVVFSCLWVTLVQANPRQVFFPQQIIGEDNLKFIEELKTSDPRLYELARAVARVSYPNTGCTGFRLAPNLFLTNHHCYSGNSCGSSSFTLGYEKNIPQSERLVLKCKNVLAVSSELDYALYEVNYQPVDKMRDTYPSVILTPKMPNVGSPLFVAGFPCCEMNKRFDASAACSLKDSGSSKEPLSHTCDTISGSSGSPVFDRSSGKVIGLHWGYQGAGANNATQMARILDDLKIKAPQAYDQLKID